MAEPRALAASNLRAGQKVSGNPFGYLFALKLREVGHHVKDHLTGRRRRIKLLTQAQKTAAAIFHQILQTEIKTEPRAKKENIKEKIIEERGYRNIRLLCEDVAEFDYKGLACAFA